MRAAFLGAGLVVLLAHVCASPAHATIDVSFGTPSPSLFPTSLYPAESLAVTVNVLNNGTSAITSNFRVGLYLQHGSSATLLGERAIFSSTLSPFPAHTTKTISITGMIPYGSAAGSRQVGVVLDNHDALAEANESNNDWLSTTTIHSGANLLITAVPTVLSSTTTSAGQTVQLSAYTITNVGNTATAATIVGYVFHNCFSPPCMLPLPTQMDGVSALAGGESYAHPAVSVAIPRNEDMTGPWRLYALLDPMNAIAEYGENDNRWAADFTMVPTLLDNLDGTITDMNTHLMWLKNANLAGVTKTWMQAVTWASDLVYAGYDDWRLPSGRYPNGSVCDTRISGYDCPNTEFASLYFGWGIHWNAMGPFTNVMYRNYWTATAWPTDPSHSMCQDFDDGGQNDYVASTPSYAWAVRRTGTVGVETPLPVRSRIVGAFPNPARGRTTIRFELAGGGTGELVVYDLAGRRVRCWPLAGLAPGAHEVTWESGVTGNVLPGLYWCRLGAAGGATRILVLR